MTAADRLCKRLAQDRNALNEILKVYTRSPNTRREATAVRLTIQAMDLTILSVENMGHVLVSERYLLPQPPYE